MNEGPRTEVCYISKLGSDDRVCPIEIETIHEDVVDASEWDVLDPVMPNDFRYEVHDRGNDVRIGRHHEQTTDAPGIKPIPFSFCVMGEKRNDRTDGLGRHEEGAIGCQFDGVRRKWLLLRSKCLSEASPVGSQEASPVGSPEASPVRGGQADYEMSREGEWGLEWAIEGQDGCRCDKEVE